MPRSLASRLVAFHSSLAACTDPAASHPHAVAANADRQLLSNQAPAPKPLGSLLECRARRLSRFESRATSCLPQGGALSCAALGLSACATSLIGSLHRLAAAGAMEFRRSL